MWDVSCETLEFRLKLTGIVSHCGKEMSLGIELVVFDLLSRR